jgi:hypothetical protein|tara:strand:+ start:16253 stop:16516 length:264 start_codon:yes stop_codon:yes gene_type:complete
MSNITYEHQFLVFNVSDGPKTINESLNTYGQEGWRLTTMITVGGGEHIVAWIVKDHALLAPDPTKSEANKIAQLWSSAEKTDDKKGK